MVIFMLKYFIIQRMKKKVQVTYLLHLWVVLVLTMVQSRPHHLRHQWSQISTFVFLNHIRHHTYFKSSYVHIQLFHILHHHTMKLLLAFKSFMPKRLIVEIGSENWFAAGCPIRQRELFRCTQPIQQRKLLRCWQPIRQRKLLRCWRHNFGSKC